MSSDLDLTEYRALSFDCYGTLIDWETGIAAVLGPWAREQDLNVSGDELLVAYADYQLIILSNVHRAGFAGSNRQLRGDFATIITAEDVGAYKPAENHFRALDAALPSLDLDRKDLLHVAQSLFHDHVPAKREGLPSVWINRRHDRPGWGATPEPAEEWTYNLEADSMAHFADAVDRAFEHAATRRSPAAGDSQQ